MKILQRYDWAPQPMTANCSYVLVKDPRDMDEATYAVYTWNRDQDYMFEGYYTSGGSDGYTLALDELVRLVKRYDKLYGKAYPGHWVFE